MILGFLFTKTKKSKYDYRDRYYRKMEEEKDFKK